MIQDADLNFVKCLGSAQTPDACQMCSGEYCCLCRSTFQTESCDHGSFERHMQKLTGKGLEHGKTP